MAQQIESAADTEAVPVKPEQSTTIEQAVSEYQADAKARELSEATNYKLEFIFRKQFHAWGKERRIYPAPRTGSPGCSGDPALSKEEEERARDRLMKPSE